MSLQEMEQRIEQLESKLAFQDDTIEDLNQAIATHNAALLKMEQQLRLMADRFKSLHTSQVAAESEETPPPHY